MTEAIAQPHQAACQKSWRPKFVVYQSQKRLAVCHVATRKEQMLELPPLMTHLQILAHVERAALQKRPRFLPVSHEAGQKERDIL